MGAARLVLDVEVRPGNQSAACYSRPGLWKLFDAFPAQGRPWLLRGDCLFGNEDTMAEAESRHLHYLFKLRLTKKPKELIKLLERTGHWVDAGQGWQGIESQLQLQGWSRKRRVIILRRRLKSVIQPVPGSKDSQPLLDWKGLFPVQDPLYEYAVLVTSLTEEVLTLAQLYRDRADAENNFDELKNQWGWAGFTTHDMERCQIAARTIALIYNWWSLFVRLADPSKRREAITSRPLLLEAVARQTTHAGQTTLVVTTPHGEASKIQGMLTQLSQFLTGLLETAEQLTQAERWHRILSRIFAPVLKGRPLATPQRVLAGA